MRKYFIKYIILSLILVSVACDDILDTAPKNELSTELGLQDISGVRAVLIGAYDQLQNTGMYGRDLVVIPELLADNMRIALQNTNRLTGQAVNQERAHVANWQSGYDLINRTNLVIDFADDTQDGTQEEKDDLKGQAFFLRALAYHDLVKAYARNPLFTNGFDLGVPLRLTSFGGLGEDDFPARSTVAEVYAQIESDLQEAIGLLTNDNGPYFATQVAAKALLARVYLYQGRWSEAAGLADEAINESGLSLEPGASYINIFSGGSESLFAVRFLAGESLGPNSALSAFYISSGDAVLRQDMIDQFDPADLRANLLLTEVQGPETVTKTTKFNNYNGGQGLDDVPVLRLSELFLIRAEANFESGGSIGDTPLNDLNAIRERAGLAPAVSITDVGDILQERRIELAFEGHRFWDLKRKGLDIPKGVAAIDCSSECSIDNDDYRVVAAIAQRELDTNNNLVQNPDYD